MDGIGVFAGEETTTRGPGRQGAGDETREGGQDKQTNDVRRLVDRGGFALCPFCTLCRDLQHSAATQVVSAAL